MANGKTRSTVDLSNDVAGCSYLHPGPVKRNLVKQGCAAEPAEFKLIDSQIRGVKTYLVLQAAAQGNCNACGQCGADSSYALIWLRLNAALKVESKKSVAVDFCRFSVLLVNADLTDEGEPIFKLKGDKLNVEYETRVVGDDETTYEFSQLEYNRRQPEKGFVIKTEKSAKSRRDSGF